MARARNAPAPEAEKKEVPLKLLNVVMVLGNEISDQLEGVFLKTGKDEFAFQADCGEVYRFRIEKMKQLIALFDNNDEGPSDDQLDTLRTALQEGTWRGY